MEVDDLTVARAERRMWQLVLLAVVVILYLTLVVVGLFFSEAEIDLGLVVAPPETALYSLFLAILILLFCAYMIVQQRRLLAFTRVITREKRTARALSRNVETLSALLDISSSINSQREVQEILDTITEAMLACFQADHSSIMLLDEETEFLRTKSSFGKGAEYAKDALIPLGKGVAGWVVANSQPLLLNGQVDADKFPGAQKKSRRISSSLCAPLKLQDKSIGVLNVNLLDPARTFSESDLKLLTIFANNAAVAIHNSMLLKERTRRIRLQTMLGQLHSPQVVQKLVERYEEGIKPTTVREKVEMTILFSDIRGFSNMLHVVEPDDIMRFLDDFYSVMNKAVFDHEGSIDKFIGDEVMAFFGAPIPLENSSINGMETACDMLRLFNELRAKYAPRSPFFESLGLGIGLNTGEVFVGNVGSNTRYEYTVIGTAVNLARRLCAYAEADQILTTEQTLARLNGRVASERLETITFKGIPDSVTVHRILDGPRRESA